MELFKGEPFTIWLPAVVMAVDVPTVLGHVVGSILCRFTAFCIVLTYVVKHFELAIGLWKMVELNVNLTNK